MSADQLLYTMDLSGPQDDWVDFDNLFQLPSEYLDSNPTSVESISPRDLDQSFTDADFLNWGSDPAVYSQPLFPEAVGYSAPAGFEQPALDSLQPFINPNDVLQSGSQISQNQFIDSSFESMWLPDTQNAAPHSSFRYMVESQAALDTRCFSHKEKRRDASIALHMQRLQHAPLVEPYTPPQPDNQFSSPNWSENSLDLPRETPASVVSGSTQKSSSPSSSSESTPGGMQFVLDLNMNTATNAPRKQKPRSRAQKENYINARKYGVCEKHRKQHKRCNCLEKAAAAHLNAASCVGGKTNGGLPTNHSRIVATSPSRSVQSPTTSVNTGLYSPLVRQATRQPKPDLSPTLAAQPSVSTAGHERMAAQNTRSTHLAFTRSESLNTPALYKDKKSQDKGQTEQSRQTIRQLMNSGSHILPQLGSRGILDTQSQAATPRAECVRVVTPSTVAGLSYFRFWQSSTASAISWASSFLGRFAVFSSGLYIRSRKGMGLL
ncbi:hypothetical protein BJX99DRAFT_225629 [Aspergillus californicus]